VYFDRELDISPLSINSAERFLAEKSGLYVYIASVSHEEGVEDG
jgi:hypothetical protein